MPAAQRWVWVSGLTVLMVGLVAALQVPVLAGYITVFGLAIVLNATLFIPTGRSAVMIAAAVMLNPLAVAVLLGIGGTLGELVGYGLGRSSRGVIGDGKADQVP
jgi:membrane protein YqaA with SNARE-associated domain